MDKKTRLIIIGILSIIIVILLSLGLTKAFMKPVEQGGNLTEISLESCAKIKLTGTSSINLSSSYPMSRNRGLQNTPYSLTVTSYCDSYVGFNLYIATLNTNTLTDENIHYILTEKGSKTAVVEGILSSATDGSSDFSDTDKTELNTGLKGTYSKIYKIHNTTVALKGNKQYDLYLFVDDSSTNTSMNKTFKAGVAVKAYDREKDQTLAEYVISQYTGTQGENGIYYHESNLTNGAGDNSYRFAGGDYQLTLKATSAGLKTVITSVKTASDGVINFYCNGTKQYVGFTCTSTYTRYYSLQYDTSNTQYQSYKEALAKAVADGYLTQNNIKNFVCFGTNESPCPTENLYRIIGVIDNKIKLIKYDYATSAILGTNGGYNNNTQVFYYSGDKESQDNIEWYTWNKTTKTNSWSDAELNTINLNTNYLNNLGSDWSNKIVTTTWQVGGNTLAKIGRTTMNLVYQNEVKTPATSTTYDAKIGLMYISDYGYAANPKYWTYQEYNSSDATKDYSAAAEANWMYGGFYDWIITRLSDYTNVVMRTLASGNVGSTTTYDATASVRMVFNLDENVIYKSGLGTQDNPIILN